MRRKILVLVVGAGLCVWLAYWLLSPVVGVGLVMGLGLISLAVASNVSVQGEVVDRASHAARLPQAVLPETELLAPGTTPPEPSRVWQLKVRYYDGVERWITVSRRHHNRHPVGTPYPKPWWQK